MQQFHTTGKHLVTEPVVYRLQNFLLCLSILMDAGAKTRVRDPSDCVPVSLVSYLLQLHIICILRGYMPY